MKIDELAAIIERVRKAKGNIDVAVTSFCGTNQAHVLFDIENIRSNFDVSNHVNGHGQFCLHVNISDHTRKDIVKGIAEMKALGERFYCSQYISEGQAPRVGLSPCEWHNPW